MICKHLCLKTRITRGLAHNNKLWSSYGMSLDLSEWWWCPNTLQQWQLVLSEVQLLSYIANLWIKKDLHLGFVETKTCVAQSILSKYGFAFIIIRKLDQRDQSSSHHLILPQFLLQ